MRVIFVGSSRRKHLTFWDDITGFPAKLRPRKERRTSILMMRHCSYLGSGQCLPLVVPRGKFDSTNHKHHPDLVSETSSVLIFCARSSDIFPRGNHWHGYPLPQVTHMSVFMCIFHNSVAYPVNIFFNLTVPFYFLYLLELQSLIFYRDK